MPAPKGISSRVSAILDKEAERLETKSDKEGLTDQDLERMKVLLQISKILVAPSNYADSAPEDVDAMVQALTPPRKDATLFPKKGPKVTAKVHEPGGA